MRSVLYIIATALALLHASPTFAEGAWCKGCEAAGKAQERTVKGRGKPDPNAVCVYAAMTDPADSVAVTISYGGAGAGKGQKVITFPVGAVQAMSGNPERPMVCIPRKNLDGATQVVMIPGSKEGCAILRPQHIAELIRVGTVPEQHPVCLAKPDQCRAKEAAAGFKRE